MEMSQIKYVLAAAKTLNFTKAARDCNVSQPALTKAIKTLEGELGSLLFHREAKRIQISEFGRSMLPHLQHIMDEAEVTRTLAKNFRLLNQVPIRLGVMSTIGPLRLAHLFASFERNHEGVELSVSEDNLTELKAKLDGGEIDLAVLNPMDGLGEGFHTHNIYTEKYVVVFPPDHRLRKLNAVKLSDLSGEPYVDRLACEMREKVIGMCQDMKFELYARFRSQREDWVQAMVFARIGFAFMPEYSVTLPGLLQRPLVDPTIERLICLVTVPGRPFTPAISAFVRAVQSFTWPA